MIWALVLLIIAVVIYLMFGGVSKADKAAVIELDKLVADMPKVVLDSQSQAEAATKYALTADVDIKAKSYQNVFTSNSGAGQAAKAASDNALKLQQSLGKFQNMVAHLEDANLKAKYTAMLPKINEHINKVQSYSSTAQTAAQATQEMQAKISALFQAADKVVDDQLNNLKTSIDKLMSDFNDQTSKVSSSKALAASDVASNRFNNMLTYLANAGSANDALNANYASVSQKLDQLKVGLASAKFNDSDLATKWSKYLSTVSAWTGTTNKQLDDANKNYAAIKSLVSQSQGQIEAAFDLKFQRRPIPGGIDYTGNDPFLNLNPSKQKMTEYECQQALIAKYPTASNGKAQPNAGRFGFGYTYSPTKYTCNAVAASVRSGTTFGYFNDNTTIPGGSLVYNDYDLPGYDYKSFSGNKEAGDCMGKHFDCSQDTAASGVTCAYYNNRPSSTPSSNACWVKAFLPTNGPAFDPKTSDTKTRMRLDVRPDSLLPL